MVPKNVNKFYTENEAVFQSDLPLLIDELSVGIRSFLKGYPEEITVEEAISEVEKLIDDVNIIIYKIKKLGVPGIYKTQYKGLNQFKNNLFNIIKDLESQSG